MIPSRRGLAASTALLAALAVPVAAQDFRMTPGLWEQTMAMKSASGEMEAKMAQAQAQMASLPPEQRAMVEKMMAGRGLQTGAQGTTLRVCVSKEMADKPTPPREHRCDQQILGRSGGTVKYRFSCPGAGGRPPTTGEGTFTMTSATAYTGTTTVDTVVQGRPEHIESTVTGRFLGADCGDVQPLRPPAR